MHVAFVELLRCPRDHAESVLVTSAHKQADRRIVDGILGCPVCGSTFPIRAGIADLRQDAAAETRGDVRRDAPNEESVVRLAAQLNLTEAGRLLALCGEYARLAPPLSVAFDAQILAINPPIAEQAHVAQHASVLRVDANVPLSPGSIHGAATDSKQSTLLGLTNIVNVLRPHGRLVAWCDVTPPAAIALLAQDEREWVGAKSAPMVTLQRGGALGRVP